MLDVAPALASVIACHGDGVLLDRLSVEGGAVPCRVAPDELLLVGPRDAGATLLERATAVLTADGADGLAADVTDAWSVWAVSGAGVDQMFARLSTNPLPTERPATVQGLLASVPAKTLLRPERAYIMVATSLHHHLPQRIREACADLLPRWHDPEPVHVR